MQAPRAKKIDKTLEKYFDIETECVSFCKKKRIDYILRCKKSDALFGLEVKNTYRKRGNDIGKFAKQSLPACGFSIGFDRLVLLLAESESQNAATNSIVYFPVMDEVLRYVNIFYVGRNY